jgi:hypothetical protein
MITADVLIMIGSSIAVTVGAVWVLLQSMHSMENRLNEKIGAVDSRLTVVETVLIMQGYPVKNLAIPEKK